MDYFKHWSDNHRGVSVQFLLDELGYFGPFFYYLMYELVNEKIQKNSGREVGCKFSFHKRVVCSASRAKWSTVGRALDAGATSGLWTWRDLGNEIEISIPILLDLLDPDQFRSRQRRAEDAAKSRLDKEEDKEEDKDKEEDILSEAEKSVPMLPTEYHKVTIEIFNNEKILLDNELIKSWVDTYPKDFLDHEFKKAKSWALANRHKAPKSQWGRFLNNWFSRGWESYRKTLKSDPVKPTFEDILEVLK